MKYTKNILTLAIAILLIFSLAACGDTADEAVNGNSESSENPIDSTDDANDDNNNNESMADKDSEDNENLNDEDSENHENISNDNSGDGDVTENDPERIFTLEELSTFDGNNGRPAYVAVDGIVYDLTDSGAWKNGRHNGFTAGKDLTEEIKEVSPHGVKNLEGISIVGKLTEE